jgi:hypothetical protein
VSEPVRIQRKRTKGWRMPPNTVYVGRGTAFGNPVVCTPHGCELKPCNCGAGCEPYRCCVKVYREYVTSGIEGRDSHTGSLSIALDAMTGYQRRSKLIDKLPSLRGKNLACWCPIIDKQNNYTPCHADVLLSLANDIPIDEVIRENTRRAKGETL